LTDIKLTHTPRLNIGKIRRARPATLRPRLAYFKVEYGGLRLGQSPHHTGGRRDSAEIASPDSIFLIFMLKSSFHKPIDIKISTVVAVSAILRSADPAALDGALLEMTGGVADFFEDDLTVIDVAALAAEGAAIDWAGLIALLKKYRLNAVAVRNASEPMRAAILAHGLSLDNAVKARDEPAAAPVAAPVEAAPPAPAAAPAPAPGAMIIDTPVRAGQRIYARGCDLIIMATVNNGAEIIADGSIHVYSSLQGRALAGASGNAEARIFALSMKPELVSIAGVYRTFEDGLAPELARNPAQIRLVGDRLDILSVNIATRT
jgi:septum site-determining protein MinC